MKKYQIVLLISMLLLTACSDKEESKENNMTKVENNLSKELKLKKVETPKEKDLLGELGFDFKDDKIIIDINKTSNFFAKIESEMKAKAKEIESKIVNSDINITKGMGIELEGNQIGIDLNKTQNMLQQINVLMKDIFLDINSSKY
jgi:uncharacterized lipoprotein YehR (DUF1307 family)